MAIVMVFVRAYGPLDSIRAAACCGTAPYAGADLNGKLLNGISTLEAVKEAYPSEDMMRFGMNRMR